MSDIAEAAGGQLDLAQAVALAHLIELEAQWENMPKPAPQDDMSATVQNLHAKQKAYEVYHAKLVAYNGRYGPAHEADRLVSTPVRLGIWCRKMRDLFLLLEHDARVNRPVHLLEKAYRYADRIGVRLNRELIRRTTPPVDTRAAIRDLETLADWCAGLDTATDPGGRPQSSLSGANQDS